MFHRLALSLRSGNGAFVIGRQSASSQSQPPSKSHPRPTAEIHEEQNPDPGPPATFDDVPIPKKGYEDEYKKQQGKFNLHLLGGVAVFGLSAFYAIKTDIFGYGQMQPPKVYTSRQKAEAEDAAAAETATTSAKETNSIFSFMSSSKSADAMPPPIPISALPPYVPYLIVGAGTAAYSAFRAIRGGDGEAKILMITEEEHNPYMRPPLSKELWFSQDPEAARQLKFKSWNGKDRSLFFEEDEFYLPVEQLSQAEHGGVAIARGMRVTRIDPDAHTAETADGQKISYGKCLIATGGRPRNLLPLKEAPAGVKERMSLFRGVNDFKELDEVSRRVKSIVIIGGGFLGSELACGLARRASDQSPQNQTSLPRSGEYGTSSTPVSLPMDDREGGGRRSGDNQGGSGGISRHGRRWKECGVEDVRRVGGER